MKTEEKAAVQIFSANESPLFSRRLRGSSLVELVIAILVLGVVLLGMMAGIMIARSSVYDKEYENACQAALKILEIIEATPYDRISATIAERNDSLFDGFRVNIAQSESIDIAGDVSSRTIVVSIDLGDRGSTRKIVSMRREVSPSASRNIGDRN
ncbi:MAG: hypothetical protein LBI74_08725 [Synergistaceae bacterium]|jgi:Tfp pilus assembly protein PilV|nr:hypothetical protein [Synergistaceae bacterium]